MTNPSPVGVLRLRAAAAGIALSALALGTVRVTHGDVATPGLLAEHFALLTPVVVAGVLAADAIVARLARALGAGRLTTDAGRAVGRSLALTVPFTIGASLQSGLASTATSTTGATATAHAHAAGAHVHAADDRWAHALQEGARVLPVALLTLLAVVLVATGVRKLSERRATRPAVSVRVAAKRRRTGAAIAVATAVTATSAVVGIHPAAAQTAPPAPPTTTGPCGPAQVSRSYQVNAINVIIPRNRWGDSDPHGMVFALRQDVSAMKDWYKPLAADANADSAHNRRVRPRPLTLRANAGECISIDLRNELFGVQGPGMPFDPRVGMHAFGVAYNAAAGDPSATGTNPDMSIAPGQSTTLYWRAPSIEGQYMIRDLANSAGGEADGGSSVHGLYGALNVEPAGATYLDVNTGNPLYQNTGKSGDLYLEAIIALPDGKQFRESTMLAQDELPAQQGFGFNYGAEPEHNRDHYKCPDCGGEETSLSSWPYGDPAMVKLASGFGPWLPPGLVSVDENGAPIPPAVNDEIIAKPGEDEGEIEDEGAEGTEVEDEGPEGAETEDPQEAPKALTPVIQDHPEDCGIPAGCWTANVTHSYVPDAFKLRFGLAGAYETHVFHLHAHTWGADPHDVGTAGTYPTKPSDTNKTESTPIDAQTYGPWEAYTADLHYGAGSAAQTVGDSIFHCHLYPHFAAGFWALLRVHDVYEDGTGTTPDGIIVQRIHPLTTNATPAAATAANPGFPRFMPGKIGWRAPQPPLGVTYGPNGPAVPRVVAGKVLSEAETVVERNAMVTQSARLGRTPVPGGPFTDPCPANSRKITYNASAIQVDITYNSDGWHDPQGRMLVLDEDIPAIRAGTKKAEPLYFRANAGDCINFRLTNRLPSWFGGTAFQQLVNTSMIGQHIHLVKFDVNASDGSSNGWNYQQAAYSGGLDAFNKKVVAGQVPCNLNDGCRMATPTAAQYDPNNVPGEEGQTLHARWYADQELKTIFTHDHHFAAVAQHHGVFGALIVEPRGFDVRDPKTGVYSQPINQAAHGTVCATACIANAVGQAKDIIGPNAGDDFREFALGIMDYVSLYRPGADVRNPAQAINPPHAPEAVPAEDPGVMGFNYRNEPLVERLNLNGQPANPADFFNSKIWGDPSTPLLRAYSKDAVKFRLIQGSQEEQHNFEVHGLRWKQDAADPQSQWVSSQSIGISEAFNLEVPSLETACAADAAGCQVDYLYGGTNIEDRYTGAWGLMRAYAGKVADLLPLPDNVPTKTVTPTYAPLTTITNLVSSIFTKPKPVSICPSTATTIREYDIVAMDMRLQYNVTFGEHDPYGLIYVLAEDEAAIRAGTKKPEPLVIRANVNDCIRVNLTNKLTNNWLNHKGILDGDAPVSTEPATGTPGGLEVSLHPQLVRYDVRSDDGANIGLNGRQTVKPGESYQYEWFADQLPTGEAGIVPLTDFGDIRGHRHHGLHASLVIEPAGSTYHDQVTGLPINSGVNADIRLPNTPDFRESVVTMNDALTLRKADGTHIHDGLALDQEDRGEVALNYISERYEMRLGRRTFGDGKEVPLNAVETEVPPPPAVTAEALAQVRSSRVHGDPSTPILRAYTGENVRMRVMGGDRGRQQVMHVGGHTWRNNPWDPGSRMIGVQGGITSGTALNMHLTAGGTVSGYGDYLYGSVGGVENLSGGLWGIFRVYPAPSTPVVGQGIPMLDIPRAGNAPLTSLDNPNLLNGKLTIKVFQDFDGDGIKDRFGEFGVSGAAVKVTNSATGKSYSTTSTSSGDAVFAAIPGGTYSVQVTQLFVFKTTKNGVIVNPQSAVTTYMGV